MATPTSLIPKSLRHVINGVDQLAEAFEVGCTGVNSITKCASNLGTLVLNQQYQRLEAEFQSSSPTPAPA